MIRIIKNTMTEPIAITCPLCKSELTYNYGDIQRQTTYNFLGMQDKLKRFIVCPVCKSDIVLDVVNTIIGEKTV